MSRFAVDPRWLVYLPPTMSPTETSAEEGLLEHPAEAFAYYRTNGVPRVVIEEKHWALGPSSSSATTRTPPGGRSGSATARPGSSTREPGRRFFEDRDLEGGVLERVRQAVDAAGLWDELATDWLLLDAELMPWSAKAQDLLRRQYGPVGVAARTALASVI